MQYLFVSTLSITFLFGVYKLLYRKDRNFHQQRFFLLSALVISVLLPLHRVEIDVPFAGSISQRMSLTEAEAIAANYTTPGTTTRQLENPSEMEEASNPSVNWMQLFFTMYLAVSGILFLRLLFQTLVILVYYKRSQKEPRKDYTIIYNTKYKQTFSFFKWIFIHKSNINNSLEEIISHEKVHAQQWHTLDLILIETLSAVMWFNPVVWLFRREVQLVHEYLADEGALDTGIDKMQYQALLLNQVTEGRLICLSFSFQSLRKKRMIKMTKQKINRQTNLKIIALIPFALILFLAIACVNDGAKSKTVTAVAPVKMNVLYLGVNNPVTIVASGYDADELEVSIDNGNIRGDEGEYIINPGQPGAAVVTVSHKGKEIQRTEFRVKEVPNPVTAVRIDHDYVTGGEISKAQLLKIDELVAHMQNFDFDLQFK
ncbi:MAG: M56 family metallopeptidase, partial [bacterium]